MRKGQFSGLHSGTAQAQENGGIMENKYEYWIYIYNYVSMDKQKLFKAKDIHLN